MKALIRIFVLVAFAAALAPAQMDRTWSMFGLVGVPSSGTGGQVGGAGNPANLCQVVTDCEDSIGVAHVKVEMYLVHPRIGDLTMTLSHCGTSVTLFSGSANQGAAASGYYLFDDFALGAFAFAVNNTQGTVQPGQYQPAQSMSAFNGQNATGPWTITIADLVSGISGTAGMATVTISSGATFGGGLNPSLLIPDGSGGACTSPVTHVVNVPYSGQVGIVKTTLGLNHTFASDLTIILSHGGVTATILAHGNPISPANLSGFYTFTDYANSTWAQGVAGLGTASTVPQGTYKPFTPMSVFEGLDQAGPWYFTICDQVGQDTGSLSSAALTIAPKAWDFQISQPNGASSITLANGGGVMGHGYANLMTLAPGAFPNGWLYGLDIGFSEIANQVGFGVPFFGVLGPCGSASTTLPGPIPSGITVYVTSLELDGSGSVAAFRPAVAYTTP